MVSTLFARIVGGVVAELIEIEAEGPPLAERFHPDIVAACVVVPDPGEVAPGWGWDGLAFTPPPPPPPPPAPVPDITARQLRLWIIGQGRALAEVDAAIGAMPEGVRDVARVEWEYSTTYQRSHPLIEQLAPLFGLATPAAIDAAFRAAAAL